MTPIELIDETVAYYTNNPRAVTHRGCSYFTNDCRMCAVGRCLLDPKDFEERFSDQAIHPAGTLSSVPDELLKPQYRGLPVRLWMDLQTIHDDHDYWEKDVAGGPSQVLSSFGETRVTEFREKWKNHE